MPEHIQLDIVPSVRPMVFLGDSRKRLREFPADVRRVAGRQLWRLQRGLQPRDFKPMPSIGRGVEEIRVWDQAGTFRVIYTARRTDAVYVLHAFQKKEQATSRRDLQMAIKRFAELRRSGQWPSES